MCALPLNGENNDFITAHFLKYRIRGTQNTHAPFVYTKSLFCPGLEWHGHGINRKPPGDELLRVYSSTVDRDRKKTEPILRSDDRPRNLHDPDSWKTDLHEHLRGNRRTGEAWMRNELFLLFPEKHPVCGIFRRQLPDAPLSGEKRLQRDRIPRVSSSRSYCGSRRSR